MIRKLLIPFSTKHEANIIANDKLSTLFVRLTLIINCVYQVPKDRNPRNFGAIDRGSAKPQTRNEA